MTAMLSTVRLLSLVVAAALAGCAATPPPAPPASREDSRLVPPDLSFTLPDGAVLPALSWLPPPGTPTRGVILALHGFGDSRDAWEMPAPQFAAAGYAVYAPDQRGFGATASRGRWAGAATMVNDAAALRAQLQARHPGLPVIVMGESMGGAIALLLAARPDTPVNSTTVLLAPAVWNRAEIGVPLRTGLWVAATVSPGWKLTGDEVPLHIQASDNRAALLRLAHDPLTLRGARVDMLSGLVGMMDQASRAASSVHGTVLVLNGERDQVVPPAAAAALWADLPATVRHGTYLAGYHLLLRDNDRDRVDADILAWLQTPDAWLPSGADLTAAAWLAQRSWEDKTSPLVPGYTLDGAFLPIDSPL